MKKPIMFLAAAVAVVFASAVQAAGVDLSSFVSPELAMGLAAASGALTTKAVQTGNVIDWVNGTGADVTADSVVKMGNLLGVALVDIADGDTGSVAVEGVFTVPKVSAAVIAQGESLTWDVSASAFDDNAAVAASGDVTGAAAVAFESAAAATTELKVKFTGVPGTVTA